MYGFQMSTDMQLKEVFRTNFVLCNLVAPPLSARKHRNRSEQLREIRHTLRVVGPWISLDSWQ